MSYDHGIYDWLLARVCTDHPATTSDTHNCQNLLMKHHQIFEVYKQAAFCAKGNAGSACVSL